MVEPDARRRRLTLVAMCFGQGMILLDTTIVNVALPSIQAELGATPATLEWVINAYVLALAALILVGGTLGDRFGRKKIYLTGLTIFTVASAGCGLATDDAALVALRAVQGTGAAMMAPLTLSILVDAYPAERRTAAIGIWAAAAGIGFGSGPVVGGILIERFDWSAVFWVNVPLGVAGFVVAAVAVRESRNPAARRLDPVGTLLVAGGLFCLTYGLVQTDDHAWTGASTLGLLAAGGVLLAGFVAWESRVAEPMVELGLFRDRAFSAGCLVYGIAYLALTGMFFFLTLYSQNVLGWSALETGLSWIPLNLPFLAVTPVAGRIVARLGPANTSALGVLLGGAGTLWLSRLGVDSTYASIWPAYALIGLGYGLLVPAVSSAAMGAVPAANSGVGAGVLNTARQVGAAVGLAVLGSIGHATATAAWSDHVSRSRPPCAAGRRRWASRWRARRARPSGGRSGARRCDRRTRRSRRACRPASPWRGSRCCSQRRSPSSGCGSRGLGGLLARDRPATLRVLLHSAWGQVAAPFLGVGLPAVTGWRAACHRSGGSAPAGPPGPAWHPPPRARPSRCRR